jgi:hypothetical protein
MFHFLDMALFITHGLHIYECVFFNSDIVGITCTLMFAQISYQISMLYPNLAAIFLMSTLCPNLAAIF